jgi:apolipoprotein N-acyltransferase
MIGSMFNKHTVLLTLLSLIAGTSFGLAFPPLNAWFLGLVALVPLFFAIERADSVKQAAWLGGIAGAVAAGITTYPLMSASVWTGWLDFTAIDNSEYFNSRAVGLYLIWMVLFTVGGMLVFGLFASILKWFSGCHCSFKYLVIAPLFWLALVEKFRSKLLFDYEWMPAGTLLIDVPWIAQLGSVGGVWILGYIVIAFNGWMYLMIFKPSGQRPHLASILFLTSLCLAALWGKQRISSLDALVADQQGIKVATIQFAKPAYTEADFTEFYMDKEYFNFVEKLFKEHHDAFDILVLPESIGFGSITLDGEKSSTMPDKSLSTIQDWYNALKPLIAQSSLFIFGADTVEKGQDYNSMLVWNWSGPIWRYHKQRLVPFAEAVPEHLSSLGLSGKSTYAFGKNSQVALTNKINLGFFICQEALFSDVINRSVKDGAEVLVSAGNDGVFANPAVAKANAIAARLRAIEAGRYVVRAMKSGISAVIQPNGSYRSSMAVGKNGVLFSKIYPLKDKTFYTYLHNYVGWFLLFVTIVLIIAEYRHRLKSH